MNKTIFYALFAMFLSACGGKAPQEEYLAELRNSEPEIRIQSLLLDSFSLGTVESSYVGMLNLSADTIYLIDKRLCRVFLFDKNGKYVSEALRVGSGPQDINSGIIDGYARIDDKDHLFIGPSNDCYLFDDSFNKQKLFIIDKGTRGENATFEEPWIYTLCYENLIFKNYANYLYYNVFSEYEGLNFIDSPAEYFEKAHYLSKLNLQTGQVEEMLGKYPRIYTESRGLKQYSFVNFDISKKGNFYISFEADSLIYEYDESFTPLCAFGYPGRNLQLKEKNLFTFMDFADAYAACRKESGFYKGIKYVDETDMLFRVYKRSSVGYGLQIYRDKVLIGDVDVPDNFEVLGYSSPNYYATTGVDEEKEEIMIYTFTL